MGTSVVDIDQCAYGLREPGTRSLYKKPTIIIGSLPCSVSLARKRSKNHLHGIVQGKVKVSAQRRCWSVPCEAP